MAVDLERASYRPQSTGEIVLDLPVGAQRLVEAVRADLVSVSFYRLLHLRGASEADWGDALESVRVARREWPARYAYRVVSNRLKERGL